MYWSKYVSADDSDCPVSTIWFNNTTYVSGREKSIFRGANLRFLPRNRSSGIVPEQLNCFYVHEHILVQLLHNQYIHTWFRSFSPKCSTYLTALDTIITKTAFFSFPLTLSLPLNLADSTAKRNMLQAMPWRRADFATHRLAI